MQTYKIFLIKWVCIALIITHWSYIEVDKTLSKINKLCILHTRMPTKTQKIEWLINIILIGYKLEEIERLKKTLATEIKKIEENIGYRN